MNNQTKNILLRNTLEFMGYEKIIEKINRNETINGYWGISPDKNIDISCIIPLLKLRDYIFLNFNMIVFIADVHAFLIKGNQWNDRTTERTEYYKFVISEILNLLNVNDQYSFVLGSNVQLDKRYIVDLFKLLTYIDVNEAKQSSADIINYSDKTILSNLIYPIMQIIDETVLDVHIEIGCIDQKKIFELSEKYIEKLNYDKCSYSITDILKFDKIYFTDSDDIIKSKILSRKCTFNDDCHFNNLVKLLLYPLDIKYPECETYQKFNDQYCNKKITEDNIRIWICVSIINLISPIRTKLINNKLYENAFYQ